MVEFVSGQTLWAIEKGQGLKKGDKVKRLAELYVVSCRAEPLNHLLGIWRTGYRRYTATEAKIEMIKEGFPLLTPLEFVLMFCKLNDCEGDVLVNRIEFEYL